MRDKNFIIGIAFPIVFLLATIYLRYKLYGYVSSDFDDFLYWWAQDLRTEGLSVIATGISNYNTPYLILLWFFGKFIPENFMMIKVISAMADVIAAIGVFKIVSHFRPGSPHRLFAATLYLLVPTVIYNSAAWGQCDGILGALVLWSFYFCLKDRLNISWILMGACFAFKMQGIFFAPFLLMVALNRRKTFLSGPLLAIVTFFVMTTPTLFFGDSLSRIFSVFVKGMGPMFNFRALSWWLPNLHQWFSNDHYDFFRIVGIVIAFVIVILLAIFGFRSKRVSNEQLMIIAAFSLIIFPFVLPQMHGRYYYQAEVMLFALMFIRTHSDFSFNRRILSFCLLESITMTTFIILNLTWLPHMNMVFCLFSIGVVAVLILLVRDFLLYPKYSANIESPYEKDVRTG